MADQAVDPELDIILGDAGAPYELVVYFSPGCPTCLSDFENKITPAIDGYVVPGELRMVFRALPILIPRISQDELEISEARQFSIAMGIAHRCAFRDGGPESFVASLSAQINAMHDVLGDGRESYRFPYLEEAIQQSSILRLMSEAGAFDREAFNECKESPVQDNIFSAFERNAQILRQTARISVPTYFMNGEQIVGDHANAPARLTETLRETLGDPE